MVCPYVTTRNCRLSVPVRPHRRYKPAQRLTNALRARSLALLAGLESETDTRNGLDEALPRAIFAELASQAVDGDAHRIACRRVVVAPDLLCDGGHRDHALAVPHQELQ